MDIDQYDIHNLKQAVGRGGIGDLRFACDFVDRIVHATEKNDGVEELREGYTAFRARNEYHEKIDPEDQTYFHNALRGDEVGAPPANVSGLGRFNSPHHPVLYLATRPEVALAEIRALPSDTCTVATFQTTRPIRLGKLLDVDKNPIAVYLNPKPAIEDYENYLLAGTAVFVSRRVSDQDRDVHYRTCNLIGSAFKDRGIDALAYRTSFWSSGWRDDQNTVDTNLVLSSNIVLFNPQDAKPVRTDLFCLNWKLPIAESLGGSGSWVDKATEEA
ncbi:RES family NAD+ phosphorylase [Pseudovibrio brasiliensis]|uniref:RES family NAD+ phosphorylase n=1 Tax=Pseudovibrio brasiliensis TaxID=1898042 RepID=A0ABX8AVG1_9HYPH|nr:RES family NAD+ phosphorylase [Pseudovibrio brasiliensis]QUS59033.1 RES family NAD+ phosphorylase [Pseudovibrio brasiliensis]